VPSPTCASARHLKRYGIPESAFDQAMRMIAEFLGIKYHRDIIETLLVSQTCPPFY
jgi:hypothetical protein